MIKLAGEASRTFQFPANLETTITYFADVPRLIGLLPHMSLVGYAENGDLRVRFSSTELSSYHINVMCDVRVNLERENKALFIVPVDNLPAIHPEATLSSTTARGYIAIDVFFEEGEDGAGEAITMVRYNLNLRGTLPTPKGLRFMPGVVLSRVAQGITSGRLKELADGFINNSTADFLGAVSKEY